MKNLNNIAKFFIICGVIFCIGMVMAIGGAAAGGVDGFKKIAEESEWISEGSGQLTSDYIEVEDFNKVDVSGDADVFLVTEKYFSDTDWLEDHELDRAMAVTDDVSYPEVEAGHVLIVRGDKVERPAVNVEKGVLNIKAEAMEFSGVSVDFSDAPATPEVYVFCKDDELEEIKASMLSGDLDCSGISFAKADIDSASGDVSMEGVTGNDTAISLKSGDVELSGKLTGTTVDSVSGDVELEGRLLGETNITVTSGDARIDTRFAAAKYTLDLKATSGDIEISDGVDDEEFDESPAVVQRGNGPNKIKVDSTSGDIKVSFQMPEEV